MWATGKSSEPNVEDKQHGVNTLQHIGKVNIGPQLFGDWLLSLLVKLEEFLQVLYLS